MLAPCLPRTPNPNPNHNPNLLHTQEWKKRWSDSGHNIDPAARFDTFRLSQDGIHALTV